MKVYGYVLVLVFAICINLYKCEEFNLSTHVLDTGKGRPAANVSVVFYKLNDKDDWILLGQGYVIYL